MFQKLSLGIRLKGLQDRKEYPQCYCHRVLGALKASLRNLVLLHELSDALHFQILGGWADEHVHPKLVPKRT
jgi:hypothetical protein